METETFYKLVYDWASDYSYKFNRPSRYSSAIAIGADSILYYTIGKKTAPKFGKIFVFESFQAAYVFHNKLAASSNYVILKGVGLRSQKASHLCCAGLMHIKDWWKRTSVPSAPTPSGTVYVDWFMPEEVLYGQA